MLERQRRKTRERIAAGKFDAALLSAQKWVQLEHCSESLFALAKCQVQTRKFRQSQGTLEQLISLDSGHFEGRALLALACYQLRQFTEAREVLNSIDGDAAGLARHTLLTLADLSMKFKLYRKARDYGERLVQLDPNKAEYWLPLANMYHYCHQPREAEQACRRALALNPNDFGACYALSQYRRAAKDGNDLELFQASFERSSQNPRARFFLGTALAKECEDLGRFGEAFEWLDVAMSTRRNELNDDSVFQERRLLWEVQRAFADIDRSGIKGFSSPRPVFIVGMPRTGTTLLEQILGVSGEVDLAGELDDFDIALWEQLGLDESGQASGAVLLEKVSQIDYTALGASYLRSAETRVGGARYFVDKKPLNFINVGFIALALPQARVICLQRGAMDTCFANFKQAYGGNSYLYSYKQEETAQYYSAYLRLMDFWGKQFPGKILNVQYEELVLNPEPCAKRVYEFLDLPWDPACLMFHTNPQVSGSASSEQVRRPIYASSVGHWRNFESELEPMRRALGELLLPEE